MTVGCLPGASLSGGGAYMYIFDDSCLKLLNEW